MPGECSLVKPSVNVLTAFENKVEGGTFDGLLVCSLNRDMFFVHAVSNSTNEVDIIRYFFIDNDLKFQSYIKTYCSCSGISSALISLDIS